MSEYEKKIRSRLAIDEASPTGLRWNSNDISRFRGKPAGSEDRSGYLQVFMKIDGKPKMFMNHRVVWFLAYGQWPQKELDHINGDKTDNRLSNLREASRSENLRNTNRSAANTSGVKGVTLDKKTGKWMARITLDRKQHYLGMFVDKSDAETAVQSARERLHGEFCNHG